VTATGSQSQGHFDPLCVAVVEEMDCYWLWCVETIKEWVTIRVYSLLLK